MNREKWAYAIATLITAYAAIRVGKVVSDADIEWYVAAFSYWILFLGLLAHWAILYTAVKGD